jgi:hypothetical protein
MMNGFKVRRAEGSGRSIDQSKLCEARPDSARFYALQLLLIRSAISVF